MGIQLNKESFQEMGQKFQDWMSNVEDYFSNAPIDELISWSCVGLGLFLILLGLIFL